MLHSVMPALGELLNYEMSFLAENAGEDGFYESLVDTVKRPLQNLYELDGLAKRKILAFCVVYAVFFLVVVKVFSGKKKGLKLQIKRR